MSSLEKLCKLGVRPKFGQRTESDLFYEVTQYLPKLCSDERVYFFCLSVYSYFLCYLMCYKFQWGAVGIQCSAGLHHRGSVDVELRSGRNDLYPLERTAPAPTSLSRYDQRSYGTYLRQIFAWLDYVGHTCRHFSMGSASLTISNTSKCFINWQTLHEGCNSE